jgi:hypothetical protein
LIGQHRAAVLAIAKALMNHRTLDAAMIDAIIAPRQNVRAGLIGLGLWSGRLASPAGRQARFGGRDGATSEIRIKADMVRSGRKVSV